MQDQLSITVEARNVYGKEVVYPVCARAQLFCRIAGTLTLTRDAVQAIRALGYTIYLAPQISEVLV